MEFKIRIHADGTAELVKELGKVQGGLKAVGESAGHGAREAKPALDQTRRGVEGVKKEVDSADRSAKGFAERLGSVGSMLGALGASLSAGAFVAKLVGVQREFDVLNSSLVTVTGSAANAEREFAWIKEFAATTPFALSEVTQAFVKMKSFGLDASAAALTSYGNTAAAMGKSLDQMIEAVADAATGEFERLKEFGVRARQQGDQVSLTFQGVTKTIGNSADEITGYLNEIGHHQFAGAMAQRAKTLDGALSNLGDTWDELFRTIASGNVGALIADSVALASGVLQDATAIIDAMTVAASNNARETGAMALAQWGVATVFETLAVVYAEVAHVVRVLGNDLGGLFAIIAARSPTEAASIWRMMQEDGETARREVDALTSSIVNARAHAAELANVMRAARDGTASYETTVGKLIAMHQSGALSADGFRVAIESLQPAITNAGTAGEEGAKALAKMAAEYDKLIAGIDDKIAAQQLEAAGITNVTAAQAEAYKLMTALRDGTLELTDAQKAGLALRLQELLALEESNRATREAAELQQAYAANVAAALSPLEARARAAHLEVQQYGLTERQIERNTLARIEEALAIARANGLIPEHIAFLEREIAARRELVAAMDDLEGLERNAAAAAEVTRAWEEAGKRIDAVFADAWKGAFSSFKDFASGLKNALWSLLGELAHMTLLRPVLVQMGVLGSGAGAAGSALAGQAGGAGFNPLTMLSGNGIGTGMSNVMTSLASSPMLAGTGAGNWLMGAAGNVAGMSNLALGGAGVLGGLGAHLLFGGKGHSGMLGGAGSTIGMAVAGPIGAVVGSVLGGALGSLFGRNKPTNYWQQTTRDVQSGDVLSQTNNPNSRRHSPENLRASDALTLAAVGAAQALHAITGQWAAESIKIGVGNRDKQLSIDGVAITSPGSDRLDRYTNDQVLDLAVVTLVERSDELSETFRTLTLAVAGGAEKVRMLGGLAAISELSGRSPTQSAADDLAAASRTATDIYREQTAEVHRLIEAYDGSVDATLAVAEAWALQQDMAYQLAGALMQTATAAEALLGGLANSIRESLMGEEELYNHRKAQVDGLVASLSTMTDPGEIFATVQEIERLTGQMWNSLSKEQQQAMGQGFLDFLEGVDALVTDVIDRALDGLDTDQASIAKGLDDAMSRAASDLAAAAETTREAASTMREAATTMREAANTMQAAASRPVKVEVAQTVKHTTSYLQQPATEVGGGY